MWRKSEEQYREYFEENPAGSYISTPDGQLIACNREYLKIFGFTSKQDAFQTPISLLFEDPNERMTFVNEISRDLYLVNKETTLKRVDGSSVTVVENASGLFDKDGKLKHIRGFLLDISKQKRLEVQIQQTQKMESIGTLAGGIAHDFNNILFPIIGYSELLIGEIPKEQTSFHKSLEQIYKSAMRAKELVQQILTFSRQEKTEYSPLKIHIIVKEVLKLQQHLATHLRPCIFLLSEQSLSCGICKHTYTFLRSSSSVANVCVLKMFLFLSNFCEVCDQKCMEIQLIIAEKRDDSE